MKSEPFYLTADHVKANLINRLVGIECDGSIKVVISDSGSKSAKQRGLNWRWNSEVAAAGIGGRHESTKDGVHLVAKYRWALPILIRDDDFFADLYQSWVERHGHDEEKMRWFVDSQVHTERMSTSQVAEFLTEFQRHYGPLVNLTDPDSMGL